MRRFLPRSLFGRLMLVLASGLIVAQLLSAAINLAERDTVLVRVMGMQPAQRIADVVRLLDSLSPAERARIVGILNVPPLVVAPDRAPVSEDSVSTGGAHAAMFDTQLPQQAENLPWRLLLTLAILLAAVLVLSYIAVRWVTRPLNVLASAADELGRDINRPPLPESGPIELSRAARAFNTMQARLIEFLDERTRLLTAMSHDLKTPLTRMRLRTELLANDSLREKFEKDLVEMETMVTQTLEFMRGLSQREPEQPIDVMALLESLQADNEAMGRTVTIGGRVTHPLLAEPQLLKRCISNLVDNATVYGQCAEIHVEEDSRGLTIRVRDHGPGISDSELEKVFEPFYRLEGSRNRETGGTGLGLSIARSIARAHGGDVRLRNHENGGLEAILTLPSRVARASSDSLQVPG